MKYVIKDLGDYYHGPQLSAWTSYQGQARVFYTRKEATRMRDVLATALEGKFTIVRLRPKGERVVKAAIAIYNMPESAPGLRREFMEAVKEYLAKHPEAD